MTDLRVNTAGQTGQPSIAIDADGDFVVVWTVMEESGPGYGIDGDLRAQRFDARGVAVGAEFQVNTTAPADQSHAAVAMSDDGDFTVVWESFGQDGSNTGIFARRYAVDGTALGGEFQVNTTFDGEQKAPAIAMDADGNFVVVWHSLAEDPDSCDVFLQRYAADGTALGGEVRVNTTTSDDQFEPAVAMARDGGFVVVWVEENGSDRDIRAQRYAADGVALGGEFLVNTTTSGQQTAPVAAMDAAGGFVLVWTSPDGGSSGIYARRYDGTGTALGSEFLVNTTTAGLQYQPAVAMAGDGSFVVTWSTGNGVFGQRYGSDGTALGLEFRVDLTGDNDVGPSVAIDEDGEFTVAWQSYDGAEFLYGISASRFGSDGAALSAADLNGTDPGTGHAATLAQGDADVPIADTDAAIAGLPSEEITGLTATLQAPPDGADETLGLSAEAAIAASSAGIIASFTYDGVTGLGVLTLSGTATRAEYQEVLRGIVYANAAPSRTTGDRTIEVRVDDGVTLGEAAVATVAVAANNPPDGAPAAALPDGTEDTPYIVLAADLLDGFSDPDGDTLSVDNLTASRGTVTDNGDGTFTITPDADFFGVMTLSYEVSDGAASVSTSLDYAVAGVEDAPVFGRRVGVDTVVNETVDGNQFAAQVAVDADGDIVVVWVGSSYYGYGSDGIFLRRYGGDGAPKGEEEQVASGAMDDLGGAAVATDQDGDFVVIWVSDDSVELRFRRYGADGIALGDEQVAATNVFGFQATGVAMDSDGDFVLVWQDYSDGYVRAQRYDADGVALGGAIDVTPAPDPEGVTPDIAMDADGDFVVVWTQYVDYGSGKDILVQRYDADGTLAGPAFSPYPDLAGDQQDAQVAMAADGNFVVAWREPGGGSTPSRVAFRLFDRDGMPFDDTVTVVSGTAPIGPIGVAMDADGDFVITWGGLSPCGCFPVVYGQRYVADGTAQSEAFVVSGGGDALPIVGAPALDADGDLVVAIDSFSFTGSGYDVHLKRYAAGSTDAIAPPGLEDTDYVVTEEALLDGFTDADDDPLTVTGLSASVGTLTDNGDGTWTYAPPPDFSGDVTLTYTVEDGTGRSALGSYGFTILAVEDAPRVIGALAVLPPGIPQITLTTDDLLVVDPEGGAVTYTVTSLAAGTLLIDGVEVTGVGATFSDADVAGGRIAYRAGPVGASLVDGIGLSAADPGGNMTVFTLDVEYGAYANLLTAPVAGSYAGTNASDAAIGMGGAANLMSMREGNDLLVGGDLADTLTAAGGEDLLFGEDGDDRLDGGLGADFISGGSGNDAMSGRDGADTLLGGAGNDTLRGGGAADSLVGGAGNDLYVVEDALDTILDAGIADFDVVRSTVDFVLLDGLDNLYLTGTANLSGTGNAGINRIGGNAGDNLLRGEDGDDVLNGGEGADTLVGSAGSDRLAGGSGADSLVGGSGNDRYLVEDAVDTIVELAGGGLDFISTGISMTMPDEVERLAMLGTSDLDATGNGLDNAIAGNAGANLLAGAAGNDTLSGNEGADTLDGGTGSDRLVGGFGNDHFRFARGEAAGDIVNDFAAGDLLVLAGYGTAAGGATFVQIASTLWQVTSADGLTSEVIRLSGAYSIGAGDYVFV
jgi:hypothetical protein